MKGTAGVLVAALLGAAAHWMSAEPAPSAPDLVDSFSAAVEGVRDYQCRLYEWCSKGRTLERRVINFYFARPRLIRMDVLRGNKALDSGSVGVYSGSGKVAGRKGGIASGIVVKVDRKSPLATTVRGQSMDESDLLGILELMKRHLASSVISVEATTGTYRVGMIPRDPAAFGGVTRDLLVFDAATLMPIYSESYEGPTQVQQARWTDYILNAGIPASFFDTRIKGAELANAGIPSIDRLPIDEGKVDERL
jgi:outer membrane lipoprotein-sorting protein